MKHKPNFICPICNNEIYVKPSSLHRRKTCSKICDNARRKDTYKGSGNPQYGLTGNLNASYRGHNEKIKNGYKFIRVFNYKGFNETFVREHRYIAEKHLLTDENSYELNGERYLKEDYHVHHLNEDKLDNRLENLIVLHMSEHTKTHNIMNPQPKSSIDGKFIKRGEC